MTAQILTLHTHNPEQSCHLAQALACQLIAGDVILLSGSVGAGKTHFARCMILARLTIPEDVPSPTYTLVQTYDADPLEIWHADLYRLSDISEIEELGLLQAFTEAICFIEWPDRLGELAPSSALSITLTQSGSEDSRNICFSWTSPRWDSLMEGLTRV